MPRYATITGDGTLDRRLRVELPKRTRSSAKKASGAGGRVVRRKLKLLVPPRLKSVRATIGMRTDSDRSAGGAVLTKVGFNVGKSRRRTIPARSTDKGVGISRANIHWWVLGTKPRKTAAGRRTGKMPANGRDLVEIAATSTKSEQLKAIADSFRKDIAKLGGGR
ncbi:MAG: hypothetical protein AAFZ07_20195 [Actinomycetota bacterium]